METFVISDLHLSDAEPKHNQRPLWKKFKQKDFFYDDSLKNFIYYIQEQVDEPCELILNGDIFDFDSVMSIPSNINFPIKKYEFNMGLNPMEIKSIFKINKILEEHSVFVDALQQFLKNKNQLIFVIGNHDLELNWKGVQEKIISLLGNEFSEQIRFCEWFYISNQDTLIEHGHQYDPYCMSINPIHPVIRKNAQYKIRLPFGNLANRFMINRMGLKNPHNDDSYTKTFWEFIKFFFKYELKTQPLMVFSWLHGASKTFIYTFGESFIPSNRDPLTYKDKLQDIAQKANTTVENVITLKETHAHSAAHNPFSLLKELWLDRALIFFIIIWFSWQVFTTSYLFVHLPISYFFIFMLCGLPVLFYYAHGISSDIHNNQDKALDLAPISAKACGVNRVILGHTHNTQHFNIGINKDVEYLNPGTWSIFFEDVECTKEIRFQNCVWINKKREANIFNWNNKTLTKVNKNNLPKGKRKFNEVS